MIKGAIFDMDGLLFDTEKVFQETWNEIADEMGIVLPPEFKYSICGTSGNLTFSVVSKFFGVPDGKAVAEDCYGRVSRKVSYGVDMKPGVREILEMFRERGVLMAVASSSAMPLIRHNLEMTGIMDYFSGIVSGQNISRGKPAPDIFLAAAREIGISPEDCCVFEDSISGIQAAHAAGMAPVMIPDLLEPDEKTRKLCLGVFRDLSEASGFLGSYC